MSLREDLIQKAVNFMKNPKVLNHTLQQKVEFLKSKQLTSEEINEVIKRVNELNNINKINDEAKYFNSNNRMSQIVRINNLLFLAGQVANDKNDNFINQTKQVFEKIDKLLSSQHSSKSKLIHATVFLKDMKNFDDFNIEWESWIDPKCPPTRACVQANMVDPLYEVEIIITAYTNNSNNSKL